MLIFKASVSLANANDNLDQATTAEVKAKSDLEKNKTRKSKCESKI